jgi:hypothetical protein
MIKLSKSGWNNVIIFVVMGFILVINVMNKKIYAPEDEFTDIKQEVTIVDQNQVILALTIDNVVFIERIGRTWRAKPTTISGQALAQMMMSWQQSSGQMMTLAPDIDRQFSLDVKLDIAGMQTPLQLNFYATEQQLLLFNQTSKQWLTFPIEIYGQLFPQEIFSSK